MRQSLGRRWCWAGDDLGQPRTGPGGWRWREARSVPLVDVWLLAERGYARTAGGVGVVHRVVGAPPLEVLLVDDGLSQVEATREIPVRPRFNTGLALLSAPVGFDKGGTGLSDRVALHQVSGEVGPGAERCPSDGCLAKPDLDAGGTRCVTSATTQMSSGSAGVGRRRALPAHDATEAAAWLGEGGAASTGAGADR